MTQEKPALGVSLQVRLIPVCSATEIGWNIEILHRATVKPVLSSH